VIFAKTCGKMKMNRRYSRKFSRKRNSAKIKKRQLHSTLCIYSVILNRRKWIIKYITVYQQQNYFSSGFLKNRTNLRFWFRNVSHNITVFLKSVQQPVENFLMIIFFMRTYSLDLLPSLFVCNFEQTLCDLWQLAPF